MNASESQSAFSVVIPLYNRSETIARAIRSAQEQTLQPLEVIVVDDGSTDSGPEAVGTEFPEVRLVHQTNSGPGPARNRGIAEARGCWVAFLDSDDIWHPDHLQELDRLISAYPDAGLAFTRYVTTPEPAELQRATGGCGALSSIDYFSANTPAFTSSTAVRKFVAEQVGGFASRMSGEDKEFWARVACYFPVAMSTSVTAIYVENQSGLSALAQRRSRIASTDLADYSFPLATVRRILESPPHDLYASPESLRWFLNYRLASKARASLLRGEVDTAKSLNQFFFPPYDLRTRALVLGLSLPQPVLRLLLEIRQHWSIP